VDGKPFRTEVTRRSQIKPTPYRGKTVDTVIIQYVAYLDGRIQEVAIDRYAQADDGSVWYFGEDFSGSAASRGRVPPGERPGGGRHPRPSRQRTTRPLIPADSFPAAARSIPV